MTGTIPALQPRGPGAQFVFYGDSCSGVPGAPHEQALARVNAVVRRLAPAPEFIVFPGDEIIGLVTDPDQLRAQWRHWLDIEMAWMDRDAIPLWHATGNHTAWDAPSEAVFREMLPHLPRNGAPGQQGLSYHVRHGDLALIFVHTLASEFGGEGHVETDWLEETLRLHADARWRLVVGHYPAFPVNGYVGDYSRTIGPEHASRFWDLLVAHEVTAYLCSHILAFDVQCHRGVLQITSAGAGTAHRMPEGVEYLHCTQMAIDGHGLRCQVLDDSGALREQFSWPPPPPSDFLPLDGAAVWAAGDGVAVLRFRGTPDPGPARQTLVSGHDVASGREMIWIGLAGSPPRLLVQIAPERGRSPHLWLGPAAGDVLDIDLMLHPSLGPGGILSRETPGGAWTTLDHTAAWGLERLPGPVSLVPGRRLSGDQPIRGTGPHVALAGSG